ncbi:MAG: recombinase family protein [bacterium]
MLKAVIYARVSSREQEKEGFSIPAQIKLLQEYAEKKGFEVVKEFTDNETAKQTGRTNFNEMINFLKKSKDTKIILVEKTDRLYRNFKDYITIGDMDLDIHFVKENVVFGKNSRSQDKFIQEIRLVMAKNYIDNLSEEIRKGLREKAEQGYLPSKPPHGYKRINNKLVEIDKEQAQFILRAFNLYAKGDKSLENVCQQLRDEDFIYKPYRPRITKPSLESMLKNVFYKGLIFYRGRIYKGVHEPIIGEQLFEKVQQAFKKDGKPLQRKEQGFIFSNLMKCPACGCNITAEIKKGKYIYYHCSWGKGKKNCSNKEYIRQEVLEEQFEEVVKRISLDETQKEWLINAIKINSHDERQYHKERIESLTQQAKQLRERIDKIYIDKLDGKIDEEFWLAKHNEWKSQLIRIKSILDSHDETHDKFINEGIRIIELACKAYDKYLNQSEKEQAKLLKILLSNCWLNGGKIDYTYKRPFNILAKGISQAIENNELKPPSIKNLTQIINRPQINDGGLWWRRRDSNSRPKRI